MIQDISMIKSAATAALPPTVRLHKVNKAFAGKPVVDDLSIDVAHGEIVALLGRTGAGKSTVLNLVLGTLTPDSGTVRVAGLDPNANFLGLRGKLAVSFQTDRLLPWRTAVENVELGLLILGRSKQEARAAALSWLERVKLADAADKYAHELSGGMRQRVSLARALAVDPEIVLLDESFSQLDHVTSRALRADFHRIAREFSKTCLLVTHRIEDALDMADRVLVLGAPARIQLELALTERDRLDAQLRGRLRDEIAAALGEEESPPAPS
ncbi:ABC transporter ATP-binding protein [Xanthobacter sp. KR7-225]|uniref:ABC transporter ATP-binding protein n=1 Tax=Xanthobacter sp. KR7-225 TaxID=3156613 RepID=UPI0032B42ACA